MADKKGLRCAIYTRKSSDEGLEQSFNSLDAQREACEAYIKSQAHEGWTAVPTQYDDGGYSGGNIERPALKRLLADLARGKIDTIVVYKVDRLTRSLADFAKIVEILDGQEASFVSITQQFNTTTSMGRLTLNVLLSFAQFEREVTGERIRDKIAASKKKGMWMGGYAPLGYDGQDRKLVVNPGEAELVRDIYRRFVELGSVTPLRNELAKRGIRSKAWQTKAGRQLGGCDFSRGALCHLLKNRTYRGEIVHREKAYPGQHEAIVPDDLWTSAQKLLAPGRRPRAKEAAPSHATLLGILFDDRGNRMSPSHANNRTGIRYRYYVSQASLKGRAGQAGSVPRVASAAIETLVGDLLSTWSKSPRGPDRRPISPELRSVLQRIEIAQDGVTLTVDKIQTCLWDRANLPGCVTVLDDRADRLTVHTPVRLSRTSGATRIEVPGSHLTVRARRDPALIKAVARAYRWKQLLLSGAVQTLEEIAKQEGCKDRYIRHVLNLAFLAPDIIEAILTGHQPTGLTTSEVVLRSPPLIWTHQRRIYL